MFGRDIVHTEEEGVSSGGHDFENQDGLDGGANSHSSQHHVDCSGEKDRTNSDQHYASLVRRWHCGHEERLTNLHDETSVPPGVLPVKDPSNIAHDLVEAAEDHSSHETPCLVSPTKPDLYHHADSVEGDQYTACREGWTITVYAHLNGTG